MSIRDVMQRKDIQYKVQRQKCHKAMAENKHSNSIKEEAFKYIASGCVNIEVSELLGINYPQVIQLRIAYESRCKK